MTNKYHVIWEGKNPNRKVHVFSTYKQLVNFLLIHSSLTKPTYSYNDTERKIFDRHVEKLGSPEKIKFTISG